MTFTSDKDGLRLDVSMGVTSTSSVSVDSWIDIIRPLFKEKLDILEEPLLFIY